MLRNTTQIPPKFPSPSTVKPRPKKKELTLTQRFDRMEKFAKSFFANKINEERLALTDVIIRELAQKIVQNYKKSKPNTEITQRIAFNITSSHQRHFVESFILSNLNGAVTLGKSKGYDVGLKDFDGSMILIARGLSGHLQEALLEVEVRLENSILEQKDIH